MKLLKHERVVRLHEVIVSAGLARNRDALLSGIAPEIVASLPHASDAAAQILRDIDTLNALGQLEDERFPLEAWLTNAATLLNGRPEADVFRDALHELESEPRVETASESGGRQRRGIFIGIGALAVLVGAIGTAFALRDRGSAEQSPGDAGASTPQASVLIVHPVVPSADPLASSAPTPEAPRPGPRPRGGAPLPPASSRALAVSPSVVTAPAAAAVILRGTATLQGRFWSLGVAAQDLSEARYVCLDPSPPRPELAGVQPTCSIITGTATCSRSDDAQQVPIGTSVAWRLPCR